MPVLDPYGDPYGGSNPPWWNPGKTPVQGTGGVFHPPTSPGGYPSPPPVAPPYIEPPLFEQPLNAPDTVAHPTPAVTTVSSPPPVTSYGGFATDPGVVAANSAEHLGLAQATQSLTDARNQAIIRWGDPALAGLAGFGMDPQAAAFAKQNYLSGNADLARLDKAKEDRKRALINQLASRGILFSGETGYQEGQNNSQYGQARYDSQNRLLDYLKQLTDQFLQQKQNFHANTLGAYQSAYDRYAGNPYAYLGYPAPA